VTAGGERVSNNNVKTKDKYVSERKILDSYNKIKDIAGQIKELNDEVGQKNQGVSTRNSINRAKMQKMRSDKI